MTAADDEIRVGTAERQTAIDLLGEHWRAGRLDPTEHEARTTKAFAAVTRADLNALFTDLPRTGPAVPWELPQVQDAPAEVLVPTSVVPAPTTRRGALATVGAGLSRARDTVMALTPIGATVLFVTGQAPWPVFLAIPAAGIILYGPGGKDGARERERERRVERDRRRNERELRRIERDGGSAS